MRKSEVRSKVPLRRRRSVRKRNAKRAAKKYERNYGKHADVIRALPCAVCGAGPSHPHHVKTRGAGGAKRDLAPLCLTCHRELHNGGRLAFTVRYGVDLEAVAHDLWTQYGTEG